MMIGSFKNWAILVVHALFMQMQSITSLGMHVSTSVVADFNATLLALCPLWTKDRQLSSKSTTLAIQPLEYLQGWRFYLSVFGAEPDQKSLVHKTLQLSLPVNMTINNSGLELSL